jgi:hypothetical protein
MNLRDDEPMTPAERQIVNALRAAVEALDRKAAKSHQPVAS